MKNYIFVVILSMLLLGTGCAVTTTTNQVAAINNETVDMTDNQNDGSIDNTSIVDGPDCTPNNGGRFGVNNPCVYKVYKIQGKPAWQVDLWFARPVNHLNFGADSRTVTEQAYLPARIKLARHTHDASCRKHSFEVLALGNVEPDMADYLLNFNADQKDVMFSSVRPASDEREFRFVLTRDGVFSQNDFAAAYQLTRRATPQPQMQQPELPVEEQPTTQNPNGVREVLPPPADRAVVQPKTSIKRPAAPTGRTSQTQPQPARPTASRVIPNQEPNPVTETPKPAEPQLAQAPALETDDAPPATSSR